MRIFTITSLVFWMWLAWGWPSSDGQVEHTLDNLELRMTSVYEMGFVLHSVWTKTIDMNSSERSITEGVTERKAEGFVLLDLYTTESLFVTIGVAAWMWIINCLKDTFCTSSEKFELKVPDPICGNMPLLYLNKLTTLSCLLCSVHSCGVVQDVYRHGPVTSEADSK